MKLLDDSASMPLKGAAALCPAFPEACSAGGTAVFARSESLYRGRLLSTPMVVLAALLAFWGCWMQGGQSAPECGALVVQ